MIVLGITGGIGSGKSVVCRIFHQLGISVYDADTAAKDLYERFPELLQKAVQEFGQEILDVKGRIDRKKLASIVFSDEEKLKKLNKMVHPLVRKDFKEWLLLHRSAPYVIKEAAILFESGADRDCTHVATVTAPAELRISRVRSRDQRTVSDVKRVMERQWPEEEKIRRSRFVINNGEQDAVLSQVLAIHEALVAEYESHAESVRKEKTA